MTIPILKNPKICYNNIFDYNQEYKINILNFLNEKILIVDDCYKNPIAIRNYILTTPCFPQKQISNFNYPGYRSETKVKMKFVELVNFLVNMYFKCNVQTNFPFISGIITTKTVHEDTSHLIHNDGKGIAGVVYLNMDEECSGGTCFFKTMNDKESSLKIDMKFNRLILYPMHLYHSGWIEPDSFNECFRITQNIFLHETSGVFPQAVL